MCPLCCLIIPSPGMAFTLETATKCLGLNTTICWEQRVVVTAVYAYLVSHSLHPTFLGGPTLASSMWSTEIVNYNSLHTHYLQVSPWPKPSWLSHKEICTLNGGACCWKEVVIPLVLPERDYLWDFDSVLLCFLSFLGLGLSAFFLWLGYQFWLFKTNSLLPIPPENGYLSDHLLLAAAGYLALKELSDLMRCLFWL